MITDSDDVDCARHGSTNGVSTLLQNQFKGVVFELFVDLMLEVLDAETAWPTDYDSLAALESSVDYGVDGIGTMPDVNGGRQSYRDASENKCVV